MGDIFLIMISILDKSDGYVDDANADSTQGSQLDLIYRTLQCFPMKRTPITLSLDRNTLQHTCMDVHGP